ncbi:hypothetical protein B0H13DRAFT_1852233 [Mycena leptocephala]|nr:hypothetical protein B0H13DRAFT_1852233 [Mycena leptocephala]
MEGDKQPESPRVQEGGVVSARAWYAPRVDRRNSEKAYEASSWGRVRGARGMRTGGRFDESREAYTKMHKRSGPSKPFGMKKSDINPIKRVTYEADGSSDEGMVHARARLARLCIGVQDEEPEGMETS